ncbi:ribosome hibernation-promoting factor, HPF/YfiA family [Carboxydothermus hydrogenoformans]|uniref:Ribosome hibernation promoting factor n=1 Tax=Carboxydothermus hydrogenoformans (strain ATCC BAA-161 / DSM 6008 / Z-2901) TaxID=246194 RepID=Q3AFQ6_CARHZ|nr:ribosome-associated translation inhibitor RaiA [Carboxydothermus hydrogenoformans]ABB15647.1 ribosomal subunit interface protein [Carboxydothermus hydrogenoformans Z-2901]
MNVQVRGKNIEVTPALKEYAEKRLAKLEKYLPKIDVVHVTLLVEGDLHKTEVTIPVAGYLLRGEEESPDMYSSIDLVVDKLERQAKKYKEKLYARFKNNKNIATGEKSAETTPEPDNEIKIVKSKRFAIKPMSPEEAAMQMELLGHSFFVFTNADTDEINVVYKRRDGKYGLIEPEV